MDDNMNKLHQENEEKIISKKDVIFIIVLLAITMMIFIFMRISRDTGYNVKITADGKTVKTLSLDKDAEYVFESDKGYNIVIIKDGGVCVKEADCPDKICVNHKKISKVGEAIICLPHKLVVEIRE
ncbi:MAG: NusG domain II-containing protein [Lachnospiraceae bacterium]|nr:NusG domain II-containing protein [Lachnospiraceae bacterium]